ncbi:Uncharacterised protein g11083 [Pycnogonum litorale]
METSKVLFDADIYEDDSPSVEVVPCTENSTCDSDDELLPAPIDLNLTDDSNDDGNNDAMTNKVCTYSLHELMSEIKVASKINKLDAELKADIASSSTKSGCKSSERSECMDSANVSVDNSFKDGDILKAHGLNVENFMLQPNDIVDCPPGRIVFSVDNCKRCFVFPTSLSLDSCGFPEFETGSKGLPSFVLKMRKMPPELLISTIKLGLFKHYFHEVIKSAPQLNAPVLNFLFLLMSVSDDIAVISACYETIDGIIEDARQFGIIQHIWVPSVNTFLTVLMNMGADPKSLLLRISKINKEEKPSYLPRLCKLENNDLQKENVMPDCEQNIGQKTELSDLYPHENLLSVLEILTKMHINECGSISPNELYVLTLILFQISLDQMTRFVEPRLSVAIFRCLEALLSRLNSDTVDIRLRLIAEDLASIDKHHHNCVHLVQMCPHSERGLKLRQLTSFYMIQNFLSKSELHKKSDIKVYNTILHLFVTMIKYKSNKIYRN